MIETLNLYVSRKISDFRHLLYEDQLVVRSTALLILTGMKFTISWSIVCLVFYSCCNVKEAVIGFVEKNPVICRQTMQNWDITYSYTLQVYYVSESLLAAFQLSLVHCEVSVRLFI